MLRARHTRTSDTAEKSPVMNSLYILDDFSHPALLGLASTVLHGTLRWQQFLPSMQSGKGLK
jgi:hypothetical protein